MNIFKLDKQKSSFWNGLRYIGDIEDIVIENKITKKYLQNHRSFIAWPTGLDIKAKSITFPLKNVMLHIAYLTKWRTKNARNIYLQIGAIITNDSAFYIK